MSCGPCATAELLVCHVMHTVFEHFSGNSSECAIYQCNLFSNFDCLSLVGTFCWQATIVTSDKNDVHLVMLEHATGKLVTGCHAPTLSSLYLWIKRHPTFKVVQPVPSAGHSMYQAIVDVFLLV